MHGGNVVMRQLLLFVFLAFQPFVVAFFTAP
jgi:hypothetical protein